MASQTMAYITVRAQAVKLVIGWSLVERDEHNAAGLLAAVLTGLGQTAAATTLLSILALACLATAFQRLLQTRPQVGSSSEVETVIQLRGRVLLRVNGPIEQLQMHQPIADRFCAAHTRVTSLRRLWRVMTDDGDRAAGMGDDVVADRTQEHPGESAVTS